MHVHTHIHTIHRQTIVMHNSNKCFLVVRNDHKQPAGPALPDPRSHCISGPTTTRPRKGTEKLKTMLDPGVILSLGPKWLPLASLGLPGTHPAGPRATTTKPDNDTPWVPFYPPCCLSLLSLLTSFLPCLPPASPYSLFPIIFPLFLTLQSRFCLLPLLVVLFSSPLVPLSLPSLPLSDIGLSTTTTTSHSSTTEHEKTTSRPPSTPTRRPSFSPVLPVSRSPYPPFQPTTHPRATHFTTLHQRRATP